jgi:hypothetical protein
VLGIAAGMIELMGGGGEAAIAAPTVIGAIPGLAAVAVGAGMVAQGFGAFGRASTNLGNDLQNLFNPMDVREHDQPRRRRPKQTTYQNLLKAMNGMSAKTAQSIHEPKPLKAMNGTNVKMAIATCGANQGSKSFQS